MIVVRCLVGSMFPQEAACWQYLREVALEEARRD
jgi:hypothetical protein